MILSYLRFKSVSAPRPRVQPVIRACILELLVRKNGPRAMLWVSKVHGKHWQGGRYEHRREEGV